MSVLDVSDVSIRYITGDFKEIGLKEYVLRRLKNNYAVKEFWADQDITFSLEQGDMLGIIGSNGAGKSTLLKVVSGIMEPTKGYIRREGTIAALLELGSGFDGDLTVRENTYLRGAMLGYTRKFMDEMYDQIIDFAELQEFQDRPFKQLSSGMKSRLAFSIASLVRPDILILDEVLSVGDGAFRKKSEEKMREIISSGATTILVSHSIQQVREMCNKVLWLNEGKQVAFGSNVDEICDQYERFLKDKQIGMKHIEKEVGTVSTEQEKNSYTAPAKTDAKYPVQNISIPRKRIIIGAVLIALAVAALIEMLTIMMQPVSVISAVTLPDDAKTLYPGIEYYTRGYDVSGPAYIPNNGDPQMGFTLPGCSIRTIIISFDEKLPDDTEIQIFYAANNESLSAEKRKDILVRKGSLAAVAELPLADYTHIRLDINGTFTLNTIKTSMELPEIKYENVSHKFDLGRLLANFTIVICVTFVAIALYNYEYVFSPLEKINDKFAAFIPRYGGICLLSIAAIFVLLQINNSSMLCYSIEIPNNIASTNMRSIGTAKSVRSDEYLVTTAGALHNAWNGKMSVPAITLSSTSLIVKINNIITFLNPYYWGELFLPEGFAFSWNFVFLTVFAVFAFYRLFKIITSNTVFSTISSLLIIFAPEMQWWWGPRSYGIWCGYIVLFYDFFMADKWWKKTIYAWGLVCCTSTIIYILYPAWDIPLIYLFALILISVYAMQKKIRLQKADMIYIGITVAMMLAVVVSYFITNDDIIKLQLETVYPGQRFSAGGGLPSSYWAHYLVAPFTTWKEFNLSINQSAISSFIHLFPIPTVIYIAKYREFKKNRIMRSLMGFKLFCSVYMVLGIGNFLAKYTLWSYSIPRRVMTVWGFASFILLLLECYYIVPIRANRKQVAGWGLVNVAITVFLIWTVYTQRELVEYIGIGSVSFTWTVISLLLLGNLLYFGFKKCFLMILCCITVVSGVIVNPINFGVGAVRDTPLAEEIRQIDEQNPGRWIALNSIRMPKYVYAQGVNCLNYLNWPPHFDLYEPIDESGEYRDIYNRYAHIRLSLTEGASSFSLVQGDYFSLKLNVDDLQTWDVDYIVCQGQTLSSTDSIDFNLLYHDDLDNVNIYGVTY